MTPEQQRAIALAKARKAKKQAEPQESLGRTIFDQSMQGATSALSDDIADRLGVAGSVLMTDPIGFFKGEVRDPNLRDEIVNARQNTEDRLQRQVEQRPVTSILSNVAGSLGTGGAAATTKAGAGVGNFIRSGNIGSRIVKGGALGSASGAAYGAGAGEDGNKTQSAGEGAVYGGVAGSAFPLLPYAASGVKNTYKGFRARDIESLDQASRSLSEAAQNSYKKMRDVGAILKPQTAANVFRSMDNALSQNKLNPRMHGKMIGLMQDMKDEILQGDITLEGFDQWRRLFKDVAGNFNDKDNARLAQTVIKAMDNSISGLSDKDLAGGGRAAIDALQDARKLYTQKMKFEAISDIVRKSDGDANYLKRELKKFVNNPKKIRGFSPSEIEALNKAASLSAGEGVMKMLGKFGIDLGASRIGNTALPALSAGAAYMSGGGAGSLAIPAIGTMARQNQKYLARGKAEDVLRAIQAGGNITKKELMKLPPREAEKILNSGIFIPGLTGSQITQ